jgi:hypothetical protein
MHWTELKVEDVAITTFSSAKRQRNFNVLDGHFASDDGERDIGNSDELVVDKLDGIHNDVRDPDERLGHLRFRWP